MTDRQAKLEQCAALCAERAWRLALALLRQREDAEDVLQQAFVVVASKPDAVPVNDPWPWFATVVTNLARNAIRKRRRHSGEDIDVCEEAIVDRPRDAADVLAAAELAERVRRELDLLPELERQALVLTHVGGLSHAVAANALKLPVGTLSSHVSRGLDRLRRRLGAEDGAITRSLAALPLAGPAGGIAAASQTWVAGAATGAVPLVTGSAGTSIGLLGGGIMTKYVMAAAVVCALALGVWYVAAQGEPDQHGTTLTTSDEDVAPSRKNGANPAGNKRKSDNEGATETVANLRPTAKPEIAVKSSESKPPEQTNPDTTARTAAPVAPEGKLPEQAPAETPTPQPAPQDYGPPTVRGRVTPALRFGEQRFSHGGGEVSALAFSPDGTIIASTGSKCVKLWDAATGESLRTFPMQTSSLVGGIEFSQDGSKFATTYLKGQSWYTTVLEVESGMEIAEVSDVTGTDFTPDGCAILGYKKKGTDDNEWVVWDYSSRNVRVFQKSQPIPMYTDERPNWSFSASASNEVNLFHFLRIWVPITDPEEKARTRHKMKQADEAPIHVWDKSTGTLLRSIVVPNTVGAMALSADGTLLATTHSYLNAPPPPPESDVPGSGHKPLITLRSAIDGKELLVLRGDEHDQGRMMFASNGTRLFSISQSGSGNAVRAWNTATGESVARYEAGPNEYITSFALSRDDTRIAAGTKGGRIIVWVLATGQLVSPKAPQEGLPVGTGSVSAAAFMPDGQKVLLAGGGNITLWSVANGKAIRKIQENVSVNALAVSPDGRLAAWSEDMRGGFKLWDIVGGEQKRDMIIGTGSVSLPGGGTAYSTPPTVEDIAWHPGGKLIATNSARSGILLWNPETGEVAASLKGHSKSVYHLSWTPDGTSLLSASWDKTIRIWDPKSGECAASMDTGGEVHALAISPDGSLAVSKAYDGKEITLWSIANRQKCRSFAMPEGTVCGNFTFTPGNCIVWSDGYDSGYGAGGRRGKEIQSRGQIRLIDSTSGGELAAFEGHEGQVGFMTVSPDGGTLLTCGQDGKVLLWKLRE